MASVEYRFPLILWEQTPDHAKQLDSAKTRFSDLGKKLDQKDIASPFCGVTFTNNCIPVVWMNTGTPYYAGKLSASEALKSAKRYGTTGYFTAEELEDYLKGKGTIVEMEMDDLGFRKHKKNPSEWVRKQKNEKDQREVSGKHWKLLYGTDYETPDKVEKDRLNKLVMVQNVNTKLGESYSVSVGRTGLIFVALDANPFVGHSAETIGELGRQIAQRAHINKDQEGFTIKARNIKLNDDETSETHDYVHVKAIKSDNKIEEVVWPATTHAQTIVDFSHDLRIKATGK